MAGNPVVAYVHQGREVVNAIVVELLIALTVVRDVEEVDPENLIPVSRQEFFVAAESPGVVKHHQGAFAGASAFTELLEEDVVATPLYFDGRMCADHPDVIAGAIGTPFHAAQRKEATL